MANIGKDCQVRSARDGRELQALITEGIESGVSDATMEDTRARARAQLRITS